MLNEKDLYQFTGTGAYHKWSVLFPNLVMTDGAKHVAEEGKAYWLMDAIGSYQHKLRNKDQFWKLKTKDNKGVLTCTNGNEKELVKQDIDYTDFPLESIELYCMNNVILLPSEY
jgi:hypothetical protein